LTRSQRSRREGRGRQGGAAAWASCLVREPVDFLARLVALISEPKVIEG
jgi:hypothetical protein